MAIQFDFCALGAIGEVQDFLRQHWSANHVLVRSSALMDWQHRDDAAGRYNFLLARDDGGAVIGMLGFIPTGRYDTDLAETRQTVWLTTWMVRRDCSSGLGLMLLRSLTSRLRPRWIGTVGLNPATRDLYRALGYRVGTLDRHYLLNEAKAGQVLARLPSQWPEMPRPGGDATLQPLSAATFMEVAMARDLDRNRQTPRKSLVYFQRRYLQHPFYEYRAYLVTDKDAAAVVMTRACRHDGAIALRVVDFLGDPAALAGSGPAFRRLLDETGAEYLDFYCSGLAAELAAAGFKILAAEDRLTLPGHFEPFDRRNVDLMYALLGEGAPDIVCKGDADQDRPNSVVETAP